MKREFKGTKGEWRVYEYDDTVVVSDIEHNGMVTEVHTPDKYCNHLAYCHDGTHWGEDIDVAQANAQLIAAAPDLLEALMIINGDIERAPNPYTSQEKMEIVENAINKALGL